MENGMKTEALGVRTVSRPWSGAMDLLFMNQTLTVNAGIIIDCCYQQYTEANGSCKVYVDSLHLLVVDVGGRGRPYISRQRPQPQQTSGVTLACAATALTFNNVKLYKNTV